MSALSRIKKYLAFVLQSAAIGIVAAALVLFFAPERFFEQRDIVTVNSSDTEVRAASGPYSYADAVSSARKAVVNIYSRKLIQESAAPAVNGENFQDFYSRFYGETGTSEQTSLGSGVLFSNQGHILTNYHVIANAKEINVLTYNNQHHHATVIGVDPETDIAVLQIKSPDITPITLGNSNQLQIGDVVLAIGNPFGVGQTVTQGIVSATGRSNLGISLFENFIQTDAAINPGNSGGALINTNGELIGVNSAIFANQGGSTGIGFAIPVSLAQTVLTQIIQNGRVIRGWMGIRPQNISPQLSQSFGLGETGGVLIAGVSEGSPAERAGILPGDIFISLDDYTVSNETQLLHRISQIRPGTTTVITGIRTGLPFQKEVIIGQRPVYRNSVR